MAMFRFRMQSLLNLKVQLEKSRKNEMATAMRRLNEEKEKLRLIQSEKFSAAREFNQSSLSGVTVSTIKQIGSYMQDLREKAQRQTDMVKREGENADRLRRELVRAMQERKIMGKLKEKQYIEHRQTLKKEEQTAVDELVSYRSGVRNGEV